MITCAQQLEATQIVQCTCTKATRKLTTVPRMCRTLEAAETIVDFAEECAWRGTRVNRAAIAEHGTRLAGMRRTPAAIVVSVLPRPPSQVNTHSALMQRTSCSECRAPTCETLLLALQMKSYFSRWATYMFKLMKC